jgi:hypothetical protein
VQALIELIAGFIALLAAVALAQFDVDLRAPAGSDREIHRLADCGDPPAKALVESEKRERC